MASHYALHALRSMAPLSDDLFFSPYRVCIFYLDEAARFSHSCIGEWAGTLIRIRLFQFFFKRKLFTSIT